jgi:hypothetical protein
MESASSASVSGSMPSVPVTTDSGRCIPAGSIDHIASWGYPKTKLQAEQIVAGSGLPWTILRVTQFYDYCLANARRLSRFPVVPVPAGFTVQPVDPRDVAARLVELALGEPAGRAPDMAGPQVSNWTDLLQGYLKATHRRRWVLPVRIPGTRAVRNGALLPPPGTPSAPRHGTRSSDLGPGRLDLPLHGDQFAMQGPHPLPVFLALHFLHRLTRIPVRLRSHAALPAGLARPAWTARSSGPCRRTCSSPRRPCPG